MTQLSRRRVLMGAGAAGTAALLAPDLSILPANAGAPAAGHQAPGFYRTKLGDFELTQFTDGRRTFPMPDGWVTNVSKAEALKASEAAYMPAGQVTVPFNPIVINTGSKLVLIDSGYGPGVHPDVGLLPKHMAAAGIDPKAIDVVILSHLHPDHINGIKTADNKLAFPNAEHMASAPDWAFWMSEDNKAKAESNGMMKAYFANTRKVLSDVADKITRYEWGKEIVPGITSISTPGHTPGHTSFAVASGNARMFVQVDVTNIPEFFLVNPDWHCVYDVDGDLASKTRHKFYDMVSAEKALVAGFHFSFPSMGHVEKNGNGYRLVPVRWASTI